MKKVLLLLTILLSVAASGECGVKPKARRTVIAGEVVNMSKGSRLTLRLNPCDPFAKDERYTARLAETGGKFHYEHDYLLPNHLTIVYENSWFQLYVEPGDSLFLRIDASRLGTPGEVQFSGNNSEKSRELTEWYRYKSIHSGNNKQLNAPLPGDASGAEYVARIKRNTAILDEILEDYSSEREMSDFARRWALIDNKLGEANILVEYGGDDLYDLATDPYFDIINPQNFGTMMYECHLGAYFTGIIRQDGQIDELLGEERAAEAFERIVSRIRKDIPRGIVRDYALMVFLGPPIDDDPCLYEELVAGKKLFRHKVFQDRLKQRASAQPKTDFPKTALTDILWYEPSGEHKVMPKVEIFDHLRERHKGKVVYVDVWGTWCPPCRSEIMNHAPALKAEFKGKDVVFVYLCLTSGKNDWVRAIRDLRIEGENYWFGETQSAILRDDYKISSVPSYFIIDRGGNIIPGAPRPSGGERLYRQLNEMLEK